MDGPEKAVVAGIVTLILYFGGTALGFVGVSGEPVVGTEEATSAFGDVMTYVVGAIVGLVNGGLVWLKANGKPA